MSRERGAAAVELALVLTLVFAVLALVAPLAVLFYSRVTLGQAAGDVVRFASSRSDVSRQAGSVTVLAGRTPTTAAVTQELLRFTAAGPITLTSLTTTPDSTCPSGTRLVLVLSTTVDLGPAGAVFAGLVGSDATTTLASDASSCRE